MPQNIPELILERINGRDIGRSCFREVTISTGKLQKSVTAPSRTLIVRTLRVTKENISRSVYCAYSPTAFSGISFSLSEEKGLLDPFEAYIFLPFGLSLTKKIDPGRMGEGLLGSDFSYYDLKSWQTTEGLKWKATDNQGAGNEAYSVIEGGWISSVKPKSIEWDRLVIYSDPYLHTIQRIDFFRHQGNGPFRRLVVPGYLDIDGVLLPASMRMENFEINHETTIQLKKAWHNKEVDEEMFGNEQIKNVKAYLSSL